MDDISPAALLEYERETLLGEIAMEEADFREAVQTKKHSSEMVSTSPPPRAGSVLLVS